MKTPIYLLLIVCIFASCNTKQTQAEIDYTSYVNPFIGTDFTGNTYPGAQAPFGMVQLSPDNGLPGWDRISGYFYPDSTIAGFSHTHLSGTGAGDLYDISFMPVTLPYKEAEAPLGIYSKFSHDDESAYAGYYQVRLKDYNINVELTATEGCGIQRYTFPKAEAAILLNLKKAMNWDFTNDSHIEVVDSVTIQGYRYSAPVSPNLLISSLWIQPPLSRRINASVQPPSPVLTSRQKKENKFWSTQPSPASVWRGRPKTYKPKYPKMTSTNIWQRLKPTGTANSVRLQ